MMLRASLLIFVVSVSSFACGSDDGPEKEQTTVDAGGDAADDASSNSTPADAAMDAEPDAEQIPEPAESPLCLGGTVSGADGCVDSEVVEIGFDWFSLAPNGRITVQTFSSGERVDFEPDLEEPLNDYCYYREELQNADTGPPCFDIGTITAEISGLSDTAAFDAERCYSEANVFRPFETTGIEVSWSGGPAADAGMLSGTAPAIPTIDVGFASNGNFRVLREEDDQYDGPMFFTVSRFEEDGVLRTIECYTPGTETLVISAEDVEEFGGFEGESWRAEFVETSLDTESTPPVRLTSRASRSGQFAQ